jgi:hypothetical protein
MNISRDCNICIFLLRSIAGNNVLEKADLQPALKALKDRLMTKNVVCISSFYLVHILLLFGSQPRFAKPKVWPAIKVWLKILKPNFEVSMTNGAYWK